MISSDPLTYSVAAVAAFKLLYDLELIHADNNIKIKALSVSIKEMMTVVAEYYAYWL